MPVNFPQEIIDYSVIIHKQKYFILCLETFHIAFISSLILRVAFIVVILRSTSQGVSLVLAFGLQNHNFDIRALTILINHLSHG